MGIHDRYTDRNMRSWWHMVIKIVFCHSFFFFFLIHRWTISKMSFPILWKEIFIAYTLIFTTIWKTTTATLSHTHRYMEWIESCCSWIYWWCTNLEDVTYYIILVLFYHRCCSTTYVSSGKVYKMDDKLNIERRS